MNTTSNVKDLSKLKPNKTTRRAINGLENVGGTRYICLDQYLQKIKKPK